MKKLFVFLLTFAMMLALVPMSAFSISETTSSDEQGVVYLLSYDRTYYSVFDFEGDTTEVVIPAVYKGRPVTEIGVDAFHSCRSLESIVIPDSVTSIGVDAFSYCESIKSIIIPDSVVTIGDGAFHDCRQLSSVVIGNSVSEISSSTFMNCYNLASVNLPDSIKAIRVNAFSDCNKLQSINIPVGVTYIGSHAFFRCDFEELIIPCTVEFVESGAFAYMGGYTSNIYLEAPYGTVASWSRNWDADYHGTVTWGYIDLALKNMTDKIDEIETGLVKSEYAISEWNEIQAIIDEMKSYSTNGKSAKTIRDNTDEFVNAVDIISKKAEFGDLNDDGEITSLDYLLVKRACFGTYELSDVELARADINRDGSADSSDYLLVKRIAFGTYTVQ